LRGGFQPFRPFAGDGPDQSSRLAGYRAEGRPQRVAVPAFAGFDGPVVPTPTTEGRRISSVPRIWPVINQALIERLSGLNRAGAPAFAVPATPSQDAWSPACQRPSFQQDSNGSTSVMHP
jgi:hypothetical protein